MILAMLGLGLLLAAMFKNDGGLLLAGFLLLVFGIASGV
jgi:hypothetical protein